MLCFRDSIGWQTCILTLSADLWRHGKRKLTSNCIHRFILSHGADIMIGSKWFAFPTFAFLFLIYALRSFYWDFREKGPCFVPTISYFLSQFSFIISHCWGYFISAICVIFGKAKLNQSLQALYISEYLYEVHHYEIVMCTTSGESYTLFNKRDMLTPSASILASLKKTLRTRAALYIFSPQLLF